MRKWTLVLALLMVLSCCLLASCGGDTETSGAASSAAESSAADESSEAASSSEEASSTADESSEEPSAEEPSESSDEDPSESSSEDTDQPSNVNATEKFERKGTNLALDATVTGADLPLRDDLTTYGAKLTDGNAADSVTYDGNWFAYWWNDAAMEQTNTVAGTGIAVVDLGASKKITSIGTNVALGCGAGIVSPASIEFAYSVDGSNYVVVGTLTYAKPDTDVELVATWVGFTLDSAVDAQYIRVSYKTQSTWTFINEIEVY